jgi:hypothetical protein
MSTALAESISLASHNNSQLRQKQKFQNLQANREYFSTELRKSSNDPNINRLTREIEDI